LLKEPPKNHLLAADITQFNKKSITLLGYLVTVKQTRTSNGLRMNFGTFLDREGYFFDTTHFPQVAEQFPFRGRGVYEVTGLVSEEFGFYSLEVTHMKKCDLKPDPRYMDVRTSTRNRNLGKLNNEERERSLEKQEAERKEIFERKALI
jgi:DNA polymerase III alpha subunit